MCGCDATKELDLFFIVASVFLNRVTVGKFELSVKNVQVSYRTSTISAAAAGGEKKRTMNVRYFAH